MPFTEAYGDPVSHLHQLGLIKAAFEASNATEPQLPDPGSPLPALLALRTTHQTIEETQLSKLDIEDRLAKARERLEKEQSDLQEGKHITTALERRIENLRQQRREQLQKTSDQSVKELLQTIQKQRTSYDREVKKLVKAFNRFIDACLAPMLVAEERGGPVVGNIIDMDWETAGEGHNKQKQHKPASEETAGSELRALTEELLNASVSDAENRSAAYVTLQRDSAASRFLVRAKIAQFSPRDARQLRLVDFGRRFDDR